MRADRQFIMLIAIALIAMVVCAGCGQKGPLRLPDAPPDDAGTSATVQPALADDPTTLSARRSNPHE
jgi:predicted small lipoprotein YifL